MKMKNKSFIDILVRSMKTSMEIPKVSYLYKVTLVLKE